MRAPLTLSITTRGIGINLCSLYAEVKDLLYYGDDDDDDDEIKIEPPNIYATYRALLALVESKFCNIWRPQHAVYPYSQILQPYYGIVTIPIIFKRYLEAISILDYKDITYIPAMSKNVFIGGKFIPRPENIILSNLRQTVEALQALDEDGNENDSTLQHREDFYRNNPIPGAIWDQTTYKLINADEIIPPDYDIHAYSDVCDDMEKLLALSMLLSKYPKYINKYCVNKNVGQISFASIISNEMGDLRVPDRGSQQTLNKYYQNSRPKGDIDTFYSRFKLRNNHFIKDGSLFLLGEYPNNERFAKPIYELRSERVNSYFYYCSYKNSSLSFHNDIVARSLKNA